MAALTMIEGTETFVTLGIDREIFAVDVRNVIEILDRRPINRLPQAPAYLLGVTDVREMAVPVVDLRLKMGLPARDMDEHSRIVILEASIEGRAMKMGLVVDCVYEVTALDASDMAPPPDVGVRWRSDYIRGIGRRNDSFVIVFNLDKLFTSDEAALIAGM